MFAPPSKSYSSLVISGDQEGQIQFWNLASSVRENIFAHDGCILDLQFVSTNNLEYIISHGSEKVFKSWKLSTKDLLNSFRYEAQFPIRLYKYLRTFDKNYMVLALNQKMLMSNFTKYASVSLQTFKDYNLEVTADRNLITQFEHLEGFNRSYFTVAYNNNVIRIADLTKLNILKVFTGMKNVVYYNTPYWKADIFLSQDITESKYYNIVSLKSMEVTHRIEGFEGNNINFFKGFNIIGNPFLLMISDTGLLKIVNPNNNNISFVEQSDSNITKSRVLQFSGCIILSDISNVHCINFGNSQRLLMS